MEAKIGQFIKAKVRFEEDDRYKIRPCLVLDKGRYPQTGETVYLVAQLSTQVDKVRGDGEVILEQSDAGKVGLAAKSVIRLSRKALIPMLASDVTTVLGSVNELPKLAATAVRNAAHRLNCRV